MNPGADFSRFVPGFDFLQDLMKAAGQTLPDIGQWVAPTLDPAELEKRIEQLKTVQFWLEQNGRMLGATIQALEVQRMTLSTLSSMNVPLSELSEALRARPAAAAAADPEAATPVSPRSRRSPASGAGSRRGAGKTAARSQTKADAPDASAPPAVDPMQWWQALTRQFGELAAQAMQDVSAQARAPGAPAQPPQGAPTRRAGAGSGPLPSRRSKHP